jgi:hypothetical protein
VQLGDNGSELGDGAGHVGVSFVALSQIRELRKKYLRLGQVGACHAVHTDQVEHEHGARGQRVPNVPPGNGIEFANGLEPEHDASQGAPRLCARVCHGSEGGVGRIPAVFGEDRGPGEQSGATQHGDGVVVFSMQQQKRALEGRRRRVEGFHAQMLGNRVLPPLHVPQDGSGGRQRTDIGFFARPGLDGLGGTACGPEMHDEAVEPLAVVGRTVAGHADDALVGAADAGAGVLDGAGAVVRGDLHLLKGIQGPPQALAQLACQRRLQGADLVLVQANGKGDAHGGARQVPAGVAVVGVVQVHGGEHHGLDGHDARREDDDGQQALHAPPPQALLLLGKGDACDAAREQQHAQEAAQPCGVGAARAREPALVGLAERRLVQHGEVGVDVVEVGGDQRLEARGRVRERGAAGGGRVVVDVGRGAGRRQRVRVAVAVDGLGLGGVASKQHKLADGAAADQRAQLEVEAEGARGANVLHLALLVGHQRERVVALAVAAALLAGRLCLRRVGQRDAQRVAQLAHLVHVGHVRLGQQALDQRLEQRQAVAQALDAAVQPLLARLRREALDVVHEAVPARLLVGLAPAHGQSVSVSAKHEARRTRTGTDLHFCFLDLHLSHDVSVRFLLSSGTLRDALAVAPVGVVADAVGAVMVKVGQASLARHVPEGGRWRTSTRAGGRHQHISTSALGGGHGEDGGHAVAWRLAVWRWIALVCTTSELDGDDGDMEAPPEPRARRRRVRSASR